MFKVYTVAAYTATVHTFIISERMHSQEDPLPDPDPLNGEDSGSDDGSGSSGDSGGNTSEENQLFIENLDEQCETLDNADEESARLQAEMAEDRERIAAHRSQLAQIRKDCGLLPWQGNPVTMIKIRTVRYGKF